MPKRCRYQTSAKTPYLVLGLQTLKSSEVHVRLSECFLVHPGMLITDPNSSPGRTAGARLLVRFTRKDSKGARRPFDSLLPLRSRNDFHTPQIYENPIYKERKAKVLAATRKRFSLP